MSQNRDHVVIMPLTHFVYKNALKTERGGSPVPFAPHTMLTHNAYKSILSAVKHAQENFPQE
jgi:hypothetical protein